MGAIKSLFLVSAAVLNLLCGDVVAQSDIQPPPSCDSSDNTLSFWRGVKQSAADIDTQGLVLTLAECLKSPNSELRDGIAYEVLTYWMRENRINDQQVSKLRIKLVPWLHSGLGESGTHAAFARAFSALILSEVLRYDTIHKSMAGEEVFEIHKAALEMFVAERDYRGLTPEFGWIHTIAHGADLLWRLAMHPLTNPDRQSELLQALSTQIVGSDIPAYTFNEADRMARVVVALVKREELSPERISAWIAQVGNPGDLETWNKAFSSPQGMAQLHNHKQFLRALMQSLKSAQGTAIERSIDEALTKLP
jgi:hypothetical protein